MIKIANIDLEAKGNLLSGFLSRFLQNLTLLRQISYTFYRRTLRGQGKDKGMGSRFSLAVWARAQTQGLYVPVEPWGCLLFFI